MSRRGKSPGRGKATTELHNKANELDVAYPDDVIGDSLRKWKSAWWLLLSTATVIALAFGLSWCDRDCRAEKAIMTPHSLLNENMPAYVPRQRFEARLKPYIARANQEYIVVVGPRGGGKSRVVEAVVANVPGVLLVDLSESQSLVNAIFSALGEHLVNKFPHRSENVLNDLFRRVALRHRDKHPADADWVPTLVVEVRSGRDGRAMTYSVATVAKSLNTDGRWCRIVLLLGDPDDAFGLPKDAARQIMIWVDDFTNDEANQFLDNIGCLPLGQRVDANNTDLNEHLRRRVFERIGTRPATLRSFANRLALVPLASLDERVDAVIAKLIKEASDVLHQLLAQNASPNGGEFRSLVEAMLQSPDHAVASETLKGNMTVSDVAATVLKRYPALMYHIPSGTYRFHSPAFLHAARLIV